MPNQSFPRPLAEQTTSYKNISLNPIEPQIAGDIIASTNPSGNFFVLQSLPSYRLLRVFPPKTEAARETLVQTIEGLWPLDPDFVSVTYGAGGSTRQLSLETCAQLQARGRVDVMAHLTSIGHTREELEAISDRLWNAGIRNIMALRGDYPQDAQPQPSEVPFAKNLIELLLARHDFCCGGACYVGGHWETPDIQIGVDHLKQKVEAGCKFLVTQMFFESREYFDFLELARSRGITEPIVPGIMPITRYSQLAKFSSQFGVSIPETLRAAIEDNRDDKAAIVEIGLAWSVKQCQELLAGGVPGLHFYTLNRSTATKRACRELGICPNLNTASSTVA